MKTTAEFLSEGRGWCWSFLRICIDMSGISTSPRDKADLGFSGTIWSSTGLGLGRDVQEFCLVDAQWRQAEVLPSARRDLAWERGCPAVSWGGCCAWLNSPCLLPASRVVDSKLGFVCPARRRVPAWYKFSA